MNELMSEDMLDDLLRDWGMQHRLDASKVEAIRASVLASPTAEALTDAWVTQHTAYLNRVFDEMRRTVQRTTQAARAARQRGPWVTTSRYRGLAHPLDWQPYCKLS
jgi:hypothetical protein